MRATRSSNHDSDRTLGLGHADPIPAPPVSSRAAAGASPAFPPGLDRVLLSLGFSEREARLYLVLLRSGPMEAREAAGSATLHRATAYRALLRLLMRGVIVGDGRTPQRFQAVGIDIILARVGAFLREEEELNALAVQAAKASVLPLENGKGSDPTHLARGPEFLARPASGLHPALLKVAGARRTVDVMFRPLAAPPSYRATLVQTIARLLRGGVYVRLVLDATVADRRLMERLAREGVGGSPALQVRHFTPLGAHSYVVDGSRTIRFPILGILTRTGDVAIVSDDPERVSTEVGRFEAVWSRATSALGRHPSTRTFGWRSPEDAGRTHTNNEFSFTPTFSTNGVVPEMGRAGVRTYIRPG
jgi:Sugar-specific transcriptional regulator TrmB